MSWILAAAWTGRTVARRVSAGLWIAYALIAGSVAAPVVWRVIGPAPRWWTIGPIGATVLALATIPGFLFAWWARLHLGRLWSAEIVVKVDHRLVQSGPYALVRHPIYTGILWAALATDVAEATPSAALSFACLASGFWLKARIEESFLLEVLPANGYAVYRRRTAMLIPGRRPLI